MGPAAQNVDVRLNNINVNAIETASGVFVGTNTQWGWQSHSKANSGLGTVTGDFNLTMRILNLVDDKDLIDTPIDDRDIMNTFVHKNGV